MTGQIQAGAGRTVLLVTYYFPPSGGPGVQRMLKFAKYLPRFGWRPIVLTVREDAEFPVRDPSLQADIPPEAEVIRTGTIEFYRLYRRLVGKDRGEPLDISTRRAPKGVLARLLQSARASLMIPDGRVGWIPLAVGPGTRLVRDRSIEVIVSSGPPFSANLIGGSIQRRTGIPWIQDFRDPWTRAPFYPDRPRMMQRIDEHLEEWTVRHATRTMSVNRWIRDDLIERYPRLDPRRLVVLPNGFDEEDFEGIQRVDRPKWTLVHTGSLFASRDPVGLRTALTDLCHQEEGFAEGTELLLAGRLDDEVSSAFRSPPLDRITRILGYVEHAESLRLLRSSHLCLLLVGQEKSVRGMLTGKLFEYLGSRTPILAIAGEGEAEEIVQNCNAGTVVDPGNVPALRDFLQAEWRRFRSGASRPVETDPEQILAFSRAALTQRLARLLEEVTEESR